MVSTMSDGWKFEQVPLPKNGRIPLKAADAISRVCYWITLHTARLFWRSSLNRAAARLCRITNRERQNSLRLPKEISFFSWDFLYPCQIREQFFPSAFHRIYQAPVQQFYPGKLTELWRNTAQLFWKLKAMTPAFAKDALSDMRNTLPAESFVTQPVSGLGVTEVTYGIGSRFGFWN